MSVHRGIVLLVSVALITVLYFLPKSVVDNDTADKEESFDQKNVMTNEASHFFAVSYEDSLKFSSLYSSIKETTGEKKKVIFADSLGRLHLKYNQLSEAATFAEKILDLDSSPYGLKMSGELFYRLFSTSSSKDDADKFGKRALYCMSKLLDEKDDIDVRAKLAMVKVASSNPMEGVMMLRSILEEYPENKTALYNMGMLSMQSGQFDKAVERFEKLISIDSENYQVMYYLAVSYFEVEDLDHSEQWFSKIIKESNNQALLASSKQYLIKLNKF